MRIFLTGCTGQCGAVAAHHFLSQGHEVYGLVRRTSSINTLRLTDILDKITLVPGDLSDYPSLIMALEVSNPDIVINLASQSFVHVSWTIPLMTADITGLGAARLLEAVRTVCPKAKFVQASSSEQFGLVKNAAPLNETSVFHPRSPYACAKIFAHNMAVNYRESYNMWVSCAIMFNYESEWRSPEFVTRKITKAVAAIKFGKKDKLKLGNMESKRDWSYCGDTVKAIQLMMEQETPDDYVIASGESHSVLEFCELAFSHVGLDYRDHVVIDKSLFRLAEVPLLLGDSSKIRNKGWAPSMSFPELVKRMVDIDLERCRTGDIF